MRSVFRTSSSLRLVLAFLYVCLLGCGGSDPFAGSWKGTVVGAGRVELTIKNGRFKMHTRDPKGVPRDIEGTVTPSGERRVELRPETIDGKPATGRDSQPFGFTLSTDGKTLQALGLVLERQ